MRILGYMSPLHAGLTIIGLAIMCGLVVFGLFFSDEAREWKRLQMTGGYEEICLNGVTYYSQYNRGITPKLTQDGKLCYCNPVESK